MIWANNLEAITRILNILQNAGLLTGAMAQANFDTVMDCFYPEEITRALENLHTAGLLAGDEAQTHFNNITTRQERASTYARNFIRQHQTQNLNELSSKQLSLKTDTFQEPIAPRHIYINPETNRVHLMMPVIGGTTIGLDNTCKSVYALQEF